MTDDINGTSKNLYLFIPNLIPSVETQLMFNEDTQNNYKISYDEYFTERRVISGLLVQDDIRSAEQVNNPEYLISSPKTKDSILTPNKNINIQIFDRLDHRQFCVEIDEQRYPRDAISKKYTENDYIDLYRD